MRASVASSKSSRVAPASVVSVTSVAVAWSPTTWVTFAATPRPMRQTIKSQLGTFTVSLVSDFFSCIVSQWQLCVYCRWKGVHPYPLNPTASATSASAATQHLSKHPNISANDAQQHKRSWGSWGIMDPQDQWTPVNTSPKAIMQWCMVHMEQPYTTKRHKWTTAHILFLQQGESSQTHVLNIC